MATRTALLLDIGFGTLEGSARSAARMGELLAARGFRCSLLRGPEVTRARVESELARLRQELRAGDGFVLYFVGHGAKLRDDAAATRGGEPAPRADVVLLITHDLFLAADPPCPGIAGAELLGWLAPLAERTGDVTVILDCCRAATMTTGVAPADDAARARLAGVLARGAPMLRAKYVARSGSDAAAQIVRVVAADQSEIAVERDLSDGTGAIGLFTDVLVDVLARAGADVPWDDLLPEIQEQVQQACPTQRPGLEGPRWRVPFSARERPPSDDFLVRRARDGWVLRGGRLHGVEVGDRFALGTGEAVAAEVGLDATMLRLASGHGPASALARGQRVACAHRHGVACRVAPALRAELAAALAGAPELALVDDDPAALATIVAEGGRLALRDRAGLALHDEPDGRASARARLLRTLRRVARWQRQAPVIAGLAALPAPATIAWGLAGSGDPLPAAGATLRPGARLRLRATGTGQLPEVFVSVMHLGADGELAHWTDVLDHGVAVPRARAVELSPETGCRTPALAWPEHVPRDAPREQALVVLVSARARSLHRMATSTWQPRDGSPVWTTRGDPAVPELAAAVLRYRLEP